MIRVRHARKEPVIIYTKSFLDTPGSEQELREILLWWEMALVRQAKANIQKRRDL